MDSDRMWELVDILINDPSALDDESRAKAKEFLQKWIDSEEKETI
jgi:hypothetical protein